MPVQLRKLICPCCNFETPSFYTKTSKAEGMQHLLECHIQVHHTTCQYCGVKCGRRKYLKNHEKKCKSKHELKVAREAMLLNCLADNETNQTTIATLTADTLRSVFRHVC